MVEYSHASSAQKNMKPKKKNLNDPFDTKIKFGFSKDDSDCITIYDDDYCYWMSDSIRWIMINEYYNEMNDHYSKLQLYKAIATDDLYNNTIRNPEEKNQQEDPGATKSI